MCAEDLGFKTKLDSRRMTVKCPFSWRQLQISDRLQFWDSDDFIYISASRSHLLAESIEWKQQILSL